MVSSFPKRTRGRRSRPGSDATRSRTSAISSTNCLRRITPAGRPWWRRLQALVAQGVQRLAGAEGRARRIAVTTALALLVMLALGRQPYRVSAPAVVEGAVQQAVVAPFDGFIAEAAFRAGQTVAEGDLLARLDDRDLKTDQRRLRAEEAELIKQHRQAVATLDHGEAKVVEAQLEQTRARLALVDAQRERTALRAPFDGVVVLKDAEHQAQVTRSAAELARFDGYLVPGGFSYQDRVRAGAVAAKDPLLRVLLEGAEAGKPILGICNGCQVLVESGIVPGIEPGAVEVALAANRMPGRRGYFSRWVGLAPVARRLERARALREQLAAKTAAAGDARTKRFLARILTWRSLFEDQNTAAELIAEVLLLLDDPELSALDTRRERAFALRRAGDLAGRKHAAPGDRRGHRRRLPRPGPGGLLRAADHRWRDGRLRHARAALPPRVPGLAPHGAPRHRRPDRL